MCVCNHHVVMKRIVISPLPFFYDRPKLSAVLFFRIDSVLCICGCVHSLRDLFLTLKKWRLCVDGSWYLSPSAAHQSVYAAQQLAAGGSRLPANGSGSTSGSPVGRSSSGSAPAGHHHHGSHRVVPYSVPSAGHKSPTTVPGKFFLNICRLILRLPLILIFTTPAVARSYRRVGIGGWCHLKVFYVIFCAHEHVRWRSNCA